MTEMFVTGGSGFVGGALIRRLVRDGHTVRALARSDAAADTVTALGAQPVRGDLASFKADGAEIVFHAAAQTSRGGGRDAFVRTNVDGTASVIAACREAGVRRLVHVGTEAALMAGQPLSGVDETAPLRPDSRASYSATKAAAEQLVRDANGDDLETVVVRPRFVWGDGDTTVLPELVKAVRSGRFAWIGGGHHLTDTTHIDNAVEGLVLAAELGKPGGVYFVTDGEPVEFRSFITDLLATQGVPAPTRNLPIGLASAAAGAGEGIWRLLGLKSAPPLDFMTVWLSSQECTLDITKAREELGYQPIRTRADGLAKLHNGQ